MPILSLYYHLSLPSPSSTTFYLGPYNQPDTYRIEESEIYNADNNNKNIDDWYIGKSCYKGMTTGGGQSKQTHSSVYE